MSDMNNLVTAGKIEDAEFDAVILAAKKKEMPDEVLQAHWKKHDAALADRVNKLEKMKDHNPAAGAQLSASLAYIGMLLSFSIGMIALLIFALFNIQ